MRTISKGSAYVHGLNIYVVTPEKALLCSSGCTLKRRRLFVCEVAIVARDTAVRTVQ
jgi:hypothetical protein